MMSSDDFNPIECGVQAIRAEAAGLAALADGLTTPFAEAVQCIMNAHGHLVVTGMGKSGHIGKKIAATFASTGTPAFFIHPAEASHGDLGMIGKQDVVLALSKSGESPELGDILNYCRRFAIPIVAITAHAKSSLSKAATHLLLLPDIAEACPLGLAPTTSTTIVLALGDALAVACLQMRDFRPAQFREFHPGGKLGQRLTRVRDVMHTEALPLIEHAAQIGHAVLAMSQGRFGCVGVLDADGRLIGIFTDGDLRRHIAAIDLQRPISELMTRQPHQMNPDALIADVAYLFTEKRIPSVFACTEGKPVGLIHIHDLLQRGFV